MKLFIHFDDDGQILSVGKVHAMEHEGHNPFIHAEKPDRVIETEAPPELQDLDAHEIAEQCVVDTCEGVLRKKAAGAKKAGAKKAELKRGPGKNDRGR